MDLSFLAFVMRDCNFARSLQTRIYAILKDHIADFRYLFLCFIIENGLAAVAYCWLFVMQDL